MFKGMKRSVTGTIAKAMALILMLSLATTSYAIIMLASSLNDAEALNVAGSMRMQSYRLAHDIEIESSDFSSHIVLFEQSIYSPSMQALQNWMVPDDITHDYYRLIMRWHDLKVVLKSPNNTQYSHLVAGFVDQIDHFVFKLQGFSERKLIQLAWVGGIGLGGVLLVSVFVVLFVRREVVLPLRTMVVASKQIQKRSFDVKISHDSRTEMGILANTFNDMALELGKRYRGLEDAVNEKTHRLQRANQSLRVLYSSSEQLTASRISADNFNAILEEMASLEGIEAVQLEIIESKEKIAVFSKGHLKDQLQAKKALTLDGKDLGNLYWNWSLPCPDQALLDNFVRILSRAVYYNQAQRQADQLILFEERATIARELHDSLAQSLSYLKIQVSLLKRCINRLPVSELHVQTNTVIAELDTGLSEAYTQLRELLTTFRLSIKEGSFDQALNTMVEQLALQTSANISLVNDLSSVDVDAHQQVHLLQLIREATINAIKHAQAKRIEISCMEYPQYIEVKIADDGIGIASDPKKAHHYGMSIMHERASRLNGELEIGVNAIGGCTVKLQYPNTKEAYVDKV
ncbi:nitrate/nitrite two-component system sensor histidine kinase NarQ [Vibrio sinensis]|uniref:Sensor protein n=1 Tax=Vibrio sinensis TaxID=2302434 RepID=A0A3A6R2Z6_9VIBR|nr:nitrate/nitrite two-component system sensor histidine kinase NarQ [Vibrio sinensis]RJX75517.1 nitrate/nitrite two-component system sensor histidine kinase NarQ [Vibrio sinensis]